VPWLRWLEAGISPRRFRFNSGSIPLGFTVDDIGTGIGDFPHAYSSLLSVTFYQFSVLKLALTVLITTSGRSLKAFKGKKIVFWISWSTGQKSISNGVSES
jgi:hypothetical protein